VREGFFDKPSYIAGAGGRFLSNVVTWAAGTNGSAGSTVRMASTTGGIVRADVINAYKAVMVQGGGGLGAWQGVPTLSRPAA
jgi:hypothetical protein